MQLDKIEYALPKLKFLLAYNYLIKFMNQISQLIQDLQMQLKKSKTINN